MQQYGHTFPLPSPLLRLFKPWLRLFQLPLLTLSRLILLLSLPPLPLSLLPPPPTLLGPSITLYLFHILSFASSNYTFVCFDFIFFRLLIQLSLLLSLSLLPSPHLPTLLVLPLVLLKLTLFQPCSFSNRSRLQHTNRHSHAWLTNHF